MSMKFKNQLIKRIYPFVDIWMSRKKKSWPEVRVKILSAKPVATPYEITRSNEYFRKII